MAHLLDANFLVALFWPRHECHPAARQWFLRHRRQGWATCALTQTAFVRLMSHPALSAGQVSPGEALRLLEANCQDSRHQYWPMDIGLAEAVRLAGVPLEGHRQVNDIYLLGLAIRRRGKIVTFDRGLGRMSPCVTLLTP